jgi:quinol monooxygenase YgiN
MILITIRIKISPNQFKELRQTLDALKRRVGKEKGFIESFIYRDVENDDYFCLMQQWKTQEDLDAYIKSENYKILLGAIRLLAESQQFITTTFILAHYTDLLLST